MKQHKEELQRVQELERCREEALKELKKTSVFLYHEAIKVDRDFFPLEFKGPTETPPKADYLAPDMEENKVKVKARRWTIKSLWGQFHQNNVKEVKKIQRTGQDKNFFRYCCRMHSRCCFSQLKDQKK